MADLFGLYEGVSSDTPNKEERICENFIRKVSQMQGHQLAHFLSKIEVEMVGFNVALTFRVPLTTETVEAFLRDAESERWYITRELGHGRSSDDAYRKKLSDKIHKLMLDQAYWKLWEEGK